MGDMRACHYNLLDNLLAAIPELSPAKTRITHDFLSLRQKNTMQNEEALSEKYIAMLEEHL